MKKVAHHVKLRLVYCLQCDIELSSHLCLRYPNLDKLLEFIYLLRESSPVNTRASFLYSVHLC